MSQIATHTLSQKFNGAVKKYAMWSAEDRLLVGVSGGPDSVALAYLALGTGLPVTLAHVNYNLREEDSKRDEQLVRDLAGEFGLPLLLFRPDFRSNLSEASSFQDKARELRYTWWELLVSTGMFTRVLTGHQADDQLETHLMYLLRGTPMASFKHIPPVRNQFCRPLIGCTRQEIIHFLDAAGLPWREDHTNKTPGYLRNAVRLDVIPILKKHQPGLTHQIGDLVEANSNILEAAQWAIHHIEPQILISTQAHFTIDLRQLFSFPFHWFALFTWLYPKGFTMDQIQRLSELNLAQSGQYFESPFWRLTHNRGQLIGVTTSRKYNFEEQIIETIPCSIPTPLGTLSLSFTEKDDLFTTDPATAVFDVKKISLPLTFRLSAPGDRIHPLGMKGSKKVKDLLIERKRHHFQKETTLVLVDPLVGIVWVVGEQLAEGAKITPDSTIAVQATWKPHFPNH